MAAAVERVVVTGAGAAGSATPGASAGRPVHVSGSSLRSLVDLVAHQVTTRLFTFVLNLAVARHIGPVAYGIAAVHLYLLNTCILFTAREAIRRSASARRECAPPPLTRQLAGSPSCIRLLSLVDVRSTLRYSAPGSLAPLAGAIYERVVLVNLSWLSLLASIPLCLLCRALFLYSPPVFETADMSIEYAECVTLYTLASFIELASEPLYILYQKHQRVRSRVVIDATAVMARCVVTFAWMKFGTVTAGGLRAFAYGQLSFACVVVVSYYASCCLEMVRNQALKKRDDGGASTQLVLFSHPRDLFPQRLPIVASSGTSTYTDPALLRLTTQLTYQSLEKLALTEGEKLVLVGLNSNLDAQGIYGLVANLGSLVARMIFQPLEESAFMEFSLLFAHITSEREKKDLAQGAAGQLPPANVSSTADTAAIASSYDSAVRMLGVLLHFVLLLGVLLMSFGPAYSYVFLDLLYGVKWSSTGAPSVLSWYCIYILFMAINGVTEAFVSAVISTRQLRTYNVCLVAFSAVYLVACALLLPYGSVGLIAANCINMALRIAYSTWFINQFFAHPVAASDVTTGAPTLVGQLRARVMPDPLTLCAFAASLVVTNLSFTWCGIEGSHSLPLFAAHIAVGGACLCAVAATIWKRERLFISELRSLAGNRRR